MSKISQKMTDSSKLRPLIDWGLSMLRNLFFILTLALAGLSSAVQAQNALPAGPSAFVLIARLHALPDQADQVVALSAAVDKKVEAGEPGMLLHTFDQDPSDPQGFIWTEVYENSEALIFHLNNADLGAYLEEVSPLLDVFTVELYGAVSDEAVAALRATGTPTTHYPQCAWIYSGPHPLRVRPAYDAADKLGRFVSNGKKVTQRVPA